MREARRPSLTQVITFLLGSEMFCVAREVPGVDSLLDIGDALSFDDEGWIGDRDRAGVDEK